MLVAFLGAQDERHFLAHSVWQTLRKIGKKCTNLSLKFETLIVGEIEQRFFLPNAVSWQIFAWQSKFGEIDPWAQFHQCSTYSL